MKEGQVSPAHVVKLHVRVAPLSVILLEASRNVWDDFWIDRQAGSYVKALKLGEEGIMCCGKRGVDSHTLIGLRGSSRPHTVPKIHSGYMEYIWCWSS